MRTVHHFLQVEENIFVRIFLFSYLEHAAIAGIIAKKDYGKLEVSFRNLSSKNKEINKNKCLLICYCICGISNVTIYIYVLRVRLKV